MDNLTELCRGCLSKETDVSFDNDNSIKEKFFEITKLQIKPDDGLPQKLCKTCKNTLNVAYAFREQCIKMDASLKAQLSKMINKSDIKLTEFMHQTETDNESDDDFASNPLKQLEAIIKKERSPAGSDNGCDDDCYYVLVIDDIKKEIQEDTCTIEEKSNNNNYGDIEFEQNHNSKEREKKSKRELREITNELLQHNNQEQNFEVESFIFSDPKVPVNVPATILENEDVAEEDNITLSKHEEMIQGININDSIEVQLDESSNNIIKTVTGKIFTQPDGSSYIKIIGADGNKILLENADEVTCLSGNDDLDGNGDDHNNEEEIILYEGDDSSQFQILKCDNSEFIIEYAENGHVATLIKQEGGKFICECGQAFEDLVEYEKHQFVHNPGQEHLCNVCGKGFETKEILEGHILVHNVPDSIIDCPVCQISVRRSALTQHIKYVHSKDKPQCEICNKTFANPNNLKRHMMIHAGIREFQCDICFKRFHQKITMQTHRITHMTPYSCSSCDDTFGRREELTEHRESGNCSKSKLNSIKEEVLKSVKNIITSSEGKLLGYACSVCKVMFSDESELEHHVESTHIYDPAEFQCIECSLVLTSKQELESHISVHNTVKNRNAKRFPCPICGKGCASHAMLVMHERVHTNERPFACHLCSLKFKTKTHLSTHQLTHTREKKFSCAFCRKSFALKGNLVVHLRTHTGERPYICSICGDGFIDSKYLKKHKLKKHT